VVAALVYAALSLLLLSPALAPGRTLSASDGLWNQVPWSSTKPPGVKFPGSNTEIGDQYHQFQPFLRHTRGTLPHIPLWNPNLMAGRPFLANGQSAIFSPFSAPAYVLPFWRSLAVIAALKLFVAALGTYFLGRALGMRFAGALLAGVVFAFSLWLVIWLSWPLSSGWAFLPWLLLCAERLARRPTALSVCALAAVVGAQFLGGHPESSFHMLAFTVVFFGLRLVQLRDPLARAGHLLRRLGAFAAAIVLGAALSALTLIPLAELLAHSADQSSRAGFTDLKSPPRYLLGLFLHDFWGRPTRVPTNSLADPFMHTRTWYVGALPLMLAGTALIRRRSFERVAIACLGLVCLLVVVGTPPFPALMKALPGFSVADNTRLAVFFVLCLALLAGWGLDDLGEPRPRLRGRPVVAFAGLLLVAPVVWMTLAGHRPWASVLWDSLRVAWGFAAPPQPPVGATAPELRRVVAEIQLASLLEWLLLAGAGLLLVAGRVTGRLRAAPFAGLAVVLVVADLFKAGMGINPAIPIEHAEQPVTPALSYLQRQVPGRFVGLHPTRPFVFGNPLPPNVAMRYGLLDARGYDFPIEDRFMRLWRRDVAGEDCPYHFCTTGAGTSPRSLRALSLLGVTDLVALPDDPLVRAPGLRVAYSGPDARVYLNSHAVPRAFVVDRQLVVGDAERALETVSSRSFQPLAVAVIEKPIRGIPVTTGRDPPSIPAGGARFVSYGDERVRLTADARRPGVLVVTDTYYPGWNATVDGKSVPLERVDYLFRGVPLAAGHHVVELRYEPTSWRVGLAVSAAALTALLLLTAVGLRRRSLGNA
jgi:hypothetical protein